MNEAPLAPDCRHCGATNSSWASECWQCHRRDWYETPRMPWRFAGCVVALLRIIVVWMVMFALFWIPVTFLDVRTVLQMVGLTILILIAVVVALAIALFSLCITFS
jgi:hypothetical protein